MVRRPKSHPHPWGRASGSFIPSGASTYTYWGHCLRTSPCCPTTPVWPRPGPFLTTAFIILPRRIGTLPGRPAAVPPPLKIIQNLGNKQNGKRKQKKETSHGLPCYSWSMQSWHQRHATHCFCLLKLWMIDPNKHVFVAISTGDTMFCST